MLILIALRKTFTAGIHKVWMEMNPDQYIFRSLDTSAWTFIVPVFGVSDKVRLKQPAQLQRLDRKFKYRS